MFRSYLLPRVDAQLQSSDRESQMARYRADISTVLDALGMLNVERFVAVYSALESQNYSLVAHINELVAEAAQLEKQVSQNDLSSLEIDPTYVSTLNDRHAVPSQASPASNTPCTTVFIRHSILTHPFCALFPVPGAAPCLACPSPTSAGARTSRGWRRISPG